MRRAWFSLAVVGLFVFPVSVRAELSEHWRTVFTSLEELAAITEPVVCVLNIQHADIVTQNLNRSGPQRFWGTRLRDQVQEDTGLRTVQVHFTEMVGRDLHRPNVRAVIITGRSRTHGRELDETYEEFIRRTHIPILGLCGGMQMIARAYGVRTGFMRRLREGEVDPNPNHHPGYFKEYGFLPVRLLAPDPLFEGLPQEIIVNQGHAAQVLSPPPGMIVLASSEACAIQVIRDRNRIVYGTQFHPEINNEQHPHGRTIMRNFYRIAGLVDDPAENRATDRRRSRISGRR